MHWTFDFIEYELTWNNGYTWESITNGIWDKEPKLGGPLLDENAMHIVLIHDQEQSDTFLPNYYQKILDYVLRLNVEFIQPSFLP